MIDPTGRCTDLGRFYFSTRSGAASFIETLKLFFIEQLNPSNRISIEKIWESCLGDEALSSGMDQIIFNKAIDLLSEAQKKEIKLRHGQSEGNREIFFEELLLYSGKLHREGFFEPAENIQECVIKCALVPNLLQLNEAKSPAEIRQIVEDCLETIEGLDREIKENRNLSAQIIPASYVEALIQNIVPKKTSKQDVKNYVKGLLPDLQGSLEDRLFNRQKNGALRLATFPLTTKLFEESNLPLIRFYSDWKGMYLVFCDPLNNLRIREDGLEEILVTNVFVPKSRSEDPPTVKTAVCIRVSNSQDLLQELANRKSVLTLPLAERYLAPLPLSSNNSFCLIKNASGYQNLRNSSASLSAEDLLQICEDATMGIEILAQAGKVSLDIHPDNISFKKKKEGTVQAQIDHFLHLSNTGMSKSSTDMRRNALAKEGYISFETDCYALVLLIAEAFFLKLRKELPLEKEALEDQALKSIEELVYLSHYQKVLEIKERSGGFQGDFSKDLLQYVKKIKAEGEESFQSEVLERFALKMAVFPEVSLLLLETLQADGVHQKMRLWGISCEQILTTSGSKIPTLEDIRNVLEKARVKLQSIPREKESTLLTEISYQNVKNIVQKIRPKDRDAEVEASAIDLCQVLNNCLNESPYVGSEFRLHKNTLWKDTLTKVPFSMWVRIQKDKMILEIFPAGREPLLGIGGVKKVKAGVSVELVKDGPLVFDPIAISRFQNGLIWERNSAAGNKVQEKILSIPEAERYFIGFPKKHAPHQIGDKVKQELISSRFNGTLWLAIQSQLLQTDEGIKTLSILDFISFLENVALGIKLIAGEGFSHGDVKTENTALVFKDGKVSARLFDFDISSTFKEHLTKVIYWAWNGIRQRYGIVTEETDVYGYSLMVVYTLLFGFESYLKGTNEVILKNLQKILDNPTASQIEFCQRRVDKMHQRFPNLIEESLIPPFLKPLMEITDVPKEIFTQITKLEKEGKTIEANALKHFVSESLFFDRVFNLLIKTLRADRISQTNMQENLKTLGIEAAAKKALQEAQFPTLDEIQNILEQCKEVVQSVEARCAEQPVRKSNRFSRMPKKYLE